MKITYNDLKTTNIQKDIQVQNYKNKLIRIVDLETGEILHEIVIDKKYVPK